MSGPRKSTSARGYGHVHQQRRLSWAPRVAAELVDCARCGKRILADEDWDLDHTDDRSGYLGPSHVRCNRATTVSRTRRTSRDW